jgi:hypothetical protein
MTDIATVAAVTIPIALSVRLVPLASSALTSSADLTLYCGRFQKRRKRPQAFIKAVYRREQAMQRNHGARTDKFVRQLAQYVALALMFIVLAVTAPFNASGQQRAEVNPDPSRQSALLALEDLLTESKGYDDRVLRVRVKAQVADVIWPIEPERAKELIISAFEDALALKELSTSRYSLRSEIIAVARSHDVDLAAELISRLEDKADDKGEMLTRDSLERISERGSLYLESARDLLREGRQGRALDFARRSFGEGRSAQFIWFLTELREKDKTAADKLFLESLNVLRLGSSDPNDVLYFGLYVFYPGIIVAGVLADGVEAIGYGKSFIAAPSPNVALVRPYIQAAGEALLRFQVVPGQAGPAGSVELKRYALNQLLPLYARYEPGLVPAMRAEFARLITNVPAPATIRRNPSPSIDPRLSVDNVVANIEQLPGAQERDYYFFEAAKQDGERGDLERARVLAARISDDSLKQPMLGVLAFKEAQMAFRRGELDEAAKIAASKLKPEQRAVIYSMVASAWSERRDQARANELVNAAIAEGTKMEDRRQRARLYSYLAGGIVKQDALRAFELIEAGVKDINAVEDYSLSDDQLTVELRTPLDTSYRFRFGKGGGLLSVLPHLAVADQFRTIIISKSLRSPELRARALIAACRAVVNSSRKPAETKKSAPPEMKGSGANIRKRASNQNVTDNLTQLTLLPKAAALALPSARLLRYRTDPS